MLVDRLLLSAEGEGAVGGGDPAPAPAAVVANGAPAAAAPWYAPAESLKTSDPEIWQSFEKSVQSGGHKDWAGVAKHAISLEKRLGAAITLPGKDAKPEDVEKWGKDINDKVKGHGYAVVKASSAPPESPDKYEVKLDAVPETLRSEPLIGEFRTIAHEEGLSQGAVSKLTALYEKMFTETVQPALAIDKEQSKKQFDQWAESVGKESKALQAFGGAWLRKNFSEEEVGKLDKLGLGDHPALLKLIAQAGLDTGEDVSIIEGEGGDSSVDTEFNDVVKMTSDPTHPDYKLWTSGNHQDPKWLALEAKRDAAYKKKYGTGSAT